MLIIYDVHDAYRIFYGGGDVITHVSVASMGVWGHAPPRTVLYSMLYEMDSDAM